MLIKSLKISVALIALLSVFLLPVLATSAQSDTEPPVLFQARTGVTWDSGDHEYDDDREWIQVIFDDDSDLDPLSLSPSDFMTEGRNVIDVIWFDLDPEEINGGPISSEPGEPEDIDGTPFVCTELGDNTFTPIPCDPAETGLDPSDIVIVHPNDGGATVNRYAHLRKTVFLLLDDEVDTDETPDVWIAGDGVDDEFGNTLDAGRIESDDFISPDFDILEMNSPRPPDSDGNVVVGEDESVEIILRSDEELGSGPSVVVSYVPCDDFPGDCDALEPDFEGGNDLNTDIDEIGLNRWRITVDPPDDFGFYSVFIEGRDISPQANQGEIGVDPSDINEDFFDDNGDVNEEDAIFFISVDDDDEGEVLRRHLQATIEAVTVFGPMEVEFRRTVTIEGDDRSIEFGVEVSTPFFQGEANIPNSDIRIKFETEDGIPVEAEAKVDTFLPNCGEIVIEMEWNGDSFGIFTEREFDEDGNLFFFARGVTVGVDEDDIGEAVICGLELNEDNIVDDELEGEIERSRSREGGDED